MNSRLRLTIRLMPVVLVIGSASLLAGCGGGNSKPATPTSPARASAVPVGSAVAGTPQTLVNGFDPNKLTAVVLRPEDVPASSRGAAGSFNPNPTSGVSFNTRYGDGSLTVTSSVTLVTDTANRDAQFSRTRKVLSRSIRGETNYNLPGADLAYRYSSVDVGASSTLVFKDDFQILIEMISLDKSNVDAATSLPEIDRLTKLVFGRLQQLIADPASVQPIPGAAQYGATAQAATATPPAAAGTPVPTP